MPDTDTNVHRKACPLCDEAMRLKTRQRISHIPGSGQTVKHTVKEWECPECSYEEEFDPEEFGG